MAILIRSLAAIACWAMLAVSPAHALVLVFTGQLDAAQVVAGGGSTSTATGLAVVSIDTTLFTITTDLSWSGLSGPTDRAHLHNAPEGQVTDFSFEHEVLGFTDGVPPRTLTCPWDDGIYLTCAPPSGTVHDVLQLSAGDGYGFPDFNSMVTGFMQEGVYLDMHTQLYPTGEIRGQLMPAVPEPSTAILFCLGLCGMAAMRRRNSGHRRERKFD